MVKVSEDQLHILRHALGLDWHGRGEFYRNHFVTGEGSVDHPDCCALVDLGMMKRFPGNAATGQMDCFRVTDAGRQQVREQSPAASPMTPAQRNYRDWLAADCDMSFIDWLKARRGRRAA